MGLLAFLPVFLIPLAALSYAYERSYYALSSIYSFSTFGVGGAVSPHSPLGVGKAQVNKRKRVWALPSQSAV